MKKYWEQAIDFLLEFIIAPPIRWMFCKRNDPITSPSTGKCLWCNKSHTPQMEPCFACGGRGYIECLDCRYHGRNPTCAKCRGYQKIVCRNCNGRGKTPIKD